MKTTTHTPVLPTAYLPPVAYFYYLIQHPIVAIAQQETYPKQTYRNRCEIVTANGKLAMILPVAKPNGNRTTTKEALLSHAEDWPVRHWRSICTAYKSSPFFLYYQDDFEAIYQTHWNSLIDFNMASLKLIVRLMQIDVVFSLSDSFETERDNMVEMCATHSPKKPCKQLHFPAYNQVFIDRHGFISNLSIVDVLFNLGPETLHYLKQIRPSESL